MQKKIVCTESELVNKYILSSNNQNSVLGVKWKEENVCQCIQHV